MSDDRGYSCVWSPCTGYSGCSSNPSNDQDCAMCQHADQYYNCGHAKDPIYLFNYHFDSVVYQIGESTGGIIILIVVVISNSMLVLFQNDSVYILGR